MISHHAAPRTGAHLSAAFSQFRRRACAPRAFTLVELVLVVTILSIVAAIAVPRMTTASANASAHALEATLNSVRKAIDCYYAEHNRFPGHDPDTGVPDGEAFIRQLTMFSDVRGRTSDTLGAPYVLGPYLRVPFPRNPVNKLNTVFVKNLRTEPDPDATAYGWVAVLADGDFGVNATDEQLDDIGVIEEDRKNMLRVINVN